MAEELQQNMQMKLCQASDETLRAITEEFKLEIDEQRWSTIVCVIFQYIDKELMAKTDEERKAFLQGLRSHHFETPEVTETSVVVNDTNVTGEKSKSPLPQKLENPTIKNMLESTSVFRRQFKIFGQIGHPDEKDKLSFTSLTRQVDSGLKQGYSEQEIVDGVIRAISAGMVLRSYVETFKDLSLERLRKILRNHYGVKNSTELYQSLASICQGPKESPQEFLMRALDLRQKILFSGTQDQGEDTLVYETDHVQKLFLRTVETGLQDENVRVRVRGYLKDSTISDEELIRQVNNAVSTEDERARKLRSQNRGKSAQVSRVAEEKNDKGQDKILETLEALKIEVAQVKSQLKERNQETEQASPPQGVQLQETGNQRKNTPKCSQCQATGNVRCFHCYICGSDNHYAVGCRQNQGRSALNSKRLPQRGRK